jgi:hypothetical protein
MYEEDSDWNYKKSIIFDWGIVQVSWSGDTDHTYWVMAI